MTIRDAYDIWAETYDTDHNLTRDLDHLVTKRSLDKITYETLLEIGCGTGKNTQWLSSIADTVIALDFSERMLNEAQKKVTACNVSFIRADICHLLPVSDARLDCIVINLVLEHIADFSHSFSEAARTLKQGGKLFISELHPFRQYQGIKAHFHRAEKTTTIQAFVHNTSDFVQNALASGFILESLNEWWHENDEEQFPRLISFEFKKK